MNKELKKINRKIDFLIIVIIAFIIMEIIVHSIIPTVIIEHEFCEFYDATNETGEYYIILSVNDTVENMGEPGNFTIYFSNKTENESLIKK